MQCRKIAILALLACASAGLLASNHKNYNASLEIQNAAGDRKILHKTDGTWQELEAECLYAQPFYTVSLEMKGEKEEEIALGPVISRKWHWLFLNIFSSPTNGPCGRIFHVPLGEERTSFLDMQDQSPDFPNVSASGSASGTASYLGFPEDMDGDGLKDESEFSLYGSRPDCKDSDSDGLDDGAEVKGRLIEGVNVRTAPFLWDTDGDGIGDAEDQKPLEPSMRESKAAWDAHWKIVAKKTGQSWEMMKNSGSYENNVYPRSFLENTRLQVSPSAICCHPGICETSQVCITVLSSCAVTGIVYAAKGGLVSRIVRDKGAFIETGLPKDFDYDMPAAFLFSRYGIEEKFHIITCPKARGAQIEEEITVWNATGSAIGKIPVRLTDSQGKIPSDTAPATPKLLSPQDGQEMNSPFSLGWHSETLTNTVTLLDPDGKYSSFVTASCGDTELAYAPKSIGLYRWSVTAKGANGYESASQSRAFYYFPDREYQDSDRDGHDDREEIMAGSDPDDPNDTPLAAECQDKSFHGQKGRHLSLELGAKGGLPPYGWQSVSPLPGGVLLSERGRLYGQPLSEGQWRLEFEIRDSASRSIRTSCLLIVRKGDDGPVQSGAGSLKCQNQF